jgi:hypothetical protein
MNGKTSIPTEENINIEGKWAGFEFRLVRHCLRDFSPQRNSVRANASPSGCAPQFK